MNNTRQRTSSGNTSHDRKLRYQALLEDLSSLENDNNYVAMDKTINAVKEAQELLAQAGIEERVKHPGEGFLDSRVLYASSDRAVGYSESVSGNVNTYDKHELARHIKENPDFWNFPFPLEVPVFASLFGTFAPTPPELRQRVPRRRVERQQQAQLKAPESVDKLEKTEEGSEMVSRVHRFINKTYCNNGRKPLNYFHVVLDPDSFSRTVENIYYVSFLVRDGLIAVHEDEKIGLPFITPVPASVQMQQGISEENQFIVSIDMQIWKDFVDAFHIKKPMMVLKRLA